MNAIVSASWLFEHHGDSNLIILDASTENNVSNLPVLHPGKQIPGARHFDFKNVVVDTESNFPNTLPTPGKFEEEVQKLGISNTSTIVVYDNIGIYASPRVWWMFLVMGHTNVAVLDGGLTSWVNNGYETENISEQKVINLGSFTTSYDKSLFRNANDIKANINSELELVIDARSSNRFKGTLPESRPNVKSGRIPKSKNLPFTEVVENGYLRPSNELVTLFDSVNPLGKNMTFTCGSGITACILKLAAHTIGFTQAAIYDGSWTEWGQLNGVPIEK